MIANGDKIEDLLKEYPSLERVDIVACPPIHPIQWTS
jgi:uncharacterized protein (DUF433 family)